MLDRRRRRPSIGPVREPTLTFHARSNTFLLAPLERPFVEVLRDLPRLLELARSDPRSRRRLFPAAYDEETDRLDWEKHAVPELAHLFDAAADLVEKDLTRLRIDPWRFTAQLRIPASNHAAWLSSLNAARLALAEIHRIDEAAMEHGRTFDLSSERDAAVVHIHLLGWIQELFVRASPGFA